MPPPEAVAFEGSGKHVTNGDPTAARRPCHVTVAMIGTTGGVYTFLACAEALKGRGHDVTFLGPEDYRELVTRSGVGFHPLLSREEYAERREVWGKAAVSAQPRS